MSFRNLSPQEMFIALANEHRPQCKFSPEQKFSEWKANTLPQVLNTLGDFPERVPLNPQMLAEWEHEGMKKQKWLIDVSKHISATFYISYPATVEKDKQYPALLCCHGHGPFGKDAVMGNGSDPDLLTEITTLNYNYGHQMAQKGFITFAIDWIGFGERDDTRKPNNHRPIKQDWCNVYYLHATMLGMTSLSINITHGKAAIDFAETLPGIDPDRIGVMGLSGGGTMTLWMALCDERLKAAEIICYSELWAHFGIRDLNYCGMQTAPGLFKLVDLPDLQGLLAPKPLLIDIGANDQCFKVDSAMKCFHHLEKIYTTADASKHLELDLHPNGHAWGGNKSLDFFGKHLR
jgi:dienelactone hydrolase